MQRGKAAAALIAVSLASSIVSAQVVSMVKDFSGETYESVAIDDAGQSIYVVATSNQFGTNPDLQRQIFRWDAASGAGAQLTSVPAGVRQVSVTDDDQWLAFVSTGDLTGGNHDGSSELFVMKTDGTSLTQLTNDTSLAGDGVLTAMISGSGNRIAFISDADPLGTNPERKPHVFAVDRDGSDLAQLAETYRVDGGAQISDDGTRVVFVDQPTPGPTNIFGVASDGSTPPGLIAAPDFLYNFRLSGNGGKVAYEAGGQISTVNYDGTDLHSQVILGYDPALSDDGQSVFYDNGAVLKANPDGTGSVLVKANVPPLLYEIAAVSGDAGRLAVRARDGIPPGGHNPDGGAEVIAMDNTGSNVLQLTDLNLPAFEIHSLVAAADASRVFFASTDDLTGANSEHYFEVFTLLANGTGLAQVTEGGLWDNVADFSVSDANVVVFSGETDLTGQNTCHTLQVFKVNPGGPITQVTDNCATSDYSFTPQIRSDGQFIFFQGNHRVGSNLDGSRELFRMTITGTGITPLTHDNDDNYKFPVISTTTSPTWIAYNCRYHVCRVNSNGTGYQLLTTHSPAYGSFPTDISGDGNKIVLASNADLAGENPNHLWQTFYYDVPTTSFHQLTHGTTYVDPDSSGRISRDGSWVYYKEVKSVYRFGGDNLLRFSTSTGVVERVPGFTHGVSYIGAFDVDSAGGKAFFFGENFLGVSPSGTSLFLADQLATPAFTIGKNAPTLLSWDPDPESTRYDVVRGDVASLAIAASTVDLGPVTCIEDDSPDNATAGNEDAAEPMPGQTFFYLYRGTKGSPPITASWGQGSGARERIAAACNP
jgi:Tol biopolymer transport system component